MNLYPLFLGPLKLKIWMLSHLLTKPKFPVCWKHEGYLHSTFFFQYIYIYILREFPFQSFDRRRKIFISAAKAEASSGSDGSKGGRDAWPQPSWGEAEGEETVRDSLIERFFFLASTRPFPSKSIDKLLILKN